MKKTLGILALFAFVLSLAACGKTDDTVEDTTADTQETIVAETTETTETSTVDLGDSKYQLSFKMTVESETDGNVAMDVEVFKDGSNLAYQFKSIESDDMDEAMMAFIPKTILVMDGITYSKVNQDGQDMWMSSTSMEDQFFGGSFDFDVIKAEVEATADDHQKEKIDGVNMDCYYKKDAVEDTKVCIEDGVVKYLESVDEYGKTTMSVYEYSDKVDDSIFQKPENVMSMEEIMMNMMQGVDVEAME